MKPTATVDVPRANAQAAIDSGDPWRCHYLIASALAASESGTPSSARRISGDLPSLDNLHVLVKLPEDMATHAHNLELAYAEALERLARSASGCTHPLEFRHRGQGNEWCGKCGLYPLPNSTDIGANAK